MKGERRTPRYAGRPRAGCGCQCHFGARRAVERPGALSFFSSLGNTPRIMDDWGQESCRAELANPSLPGVTSSRVLHRKGCRNLEGVAATYVLVGDGDRIHDPRHTRNLESDRLGRPAVNPCAH